MASMSAVCCIVDADGFDIRVTSDNSPCYNTKFLIRELAYIRVEPDHEFFPVSTRFDLRREIDFRTISREVHRTLRYQSERVTGLSIHPSSGETVVDYSSLHGVVRAMYDSCKQPGRFVVAYKGGNKEKDLLDALEIPSLDLQLFGCLPYSVLIKQGKTYSRLVDCGFHRTSASNTLLHCPMAEVVAYRDWYALNCDRSLKTCESDSDSDF